MVRSVRLISAHPLSHTLPSYIASSLKPLARPASGSGSGSGSDKPQPPDKTEQDKEAKSGANKPLPGGGYAKRADEEGFGALYGGNQSLSKDDNEKIVHGNVPEYDGSKKSS